MNYLQKIFTILFLSLTFAAALSAQNVSHSTFYYQRVSLFEKLPTSNEDIIFLGNSITNGGEWAELLNDNIKSDSPNTSIYIQSILPVNESFGMFNGHTQHKNIIKPLNERLECLADKKSVRFVDLYSHFIRPGTHSLATKYTNDGLHLMGEGYLKWIELIKPYIYE